MRPEPAPRAAAVEGPSLRSSVAPPSPRPARVVRRAVGPAGGPESERPTPVPPSGDRPSAGPSVASALSRSAPAGTKLDGDVALTDDELVARAQRGDAAAFRELFRAHRQAVSRIAYRMLGAHGDLEDVVQEVFLQVHRSLPDFRGQAKFSTWLHRVAVNVVLMARRRARSRPTFAAEEAGRHEADARPLPDHDLARNRRLAAFRALLDRLSEKKRTVFVLHELEGMSPSQIAEVVDCPVLTVRTRLFYARRELAQLMRSEPHLAQLCEDAELGLDDAEAGAGAGDDRAGDGSEARAHREAP
ncbi:MAG: sigma-70 family RNA polymerase sigma factor [Polyangiaceae bacterium]|nr:sigma-70 family RNA polymerase sigma factor [Polyangiaceae bacterium]